MEEELEDDEDLEAIYNQLLTKICPKFLDRNDPDEQKRFYVEHY